MDIHVKLKTNPTSVILVDSLLMAQNTSSETSLSYWPKTLPPRRVSINGTKTLLRRPFSLMALKPFLGIHRNQSGPGQVDKNSNNNILDQHKLYLKKSYKMAPQNLQQILYK